MKSIIFIGMRGTGKTSLGKAIAKKLNLGFVDTDHLIEQNKGMKCNDIVDKHGWDEFRLTEKQVLDSFDPNTKQVIATGGGLPFYFDNKENLKKLGVVVWLKASPKFVKKMISLSKGKRPSLTGDNIVDEIDDILEERNPVYEELSDITITLDGKHWKDIVKNTLEAVEKLEHLDNSK